MLFSCIGAAIEFSTHSFWEDAGFSEHYSYRVIFGGSLFTNVTQTEYTVESDLTPVFRAATDGCYGQSGPAIITEILGTYRARWEKL